jgi:WLM domain
MSKEELLFYIIFFFVAFYCLSVYYDMDTFSLKCVISDVDGKKYCVRDRKDLSETADLLASVTQKCTNLVKYVGEKHNTNEDVQRLVENFNPKTISETLPTSELTAYSENKGEKIAFCLTETKNGKKLIDLNTLTFVAIHELSHLMTKSIGHKLEFWQHFKFLLENAKEAGIYEPIDYKNNSQEFCGMKITDNPYYDLND